MIEKRVAFKSYIMWWQFISVASTTQGASFKKKKKKVFSLQLRFFHSLNIHPFLHFLHLFWLLSCLLSLPPHFPSFGFYFSLCLPLSCSFLPPLLSPFHSFHSSPMSSSSYFANALLISASVASRRLHFLDFSSYFYFAAFVKPLSPHCRA